MKINFITMSRLPNAEHYQLHTDIKNLMQRYDPQALKIKPQYDDYLLLYNKVDTGYKKINKSCLTEQIHEADMARDDTWKGLAGAISSALRHFDPQVREAARQLNIVRRTYGNVTRMTYNGQTAAIYNFAQDLEGPYAQHTAKAGLQSWIIELKARNIAVANLMRDRFDEAAAKSDIVLREARAELDKAYFAIRDRISALVLIEGLAAYEEFIKTLNTIIATYNLFLGSRKGKREKRSKAVAE